MASKAGFTLVEILLAAAITVILVAILLRITTLAGTTVNLSTQALTAFSSARSAFDIVTTNLSQATLNTYLDYYGDPTGTQPIYRRTDNNIVNTFRPVAYGRASDLQFLVQPNQVHSYYGQEVYFQAPRSYSTDANFQSVPGLLNCCGYYVQFAGNQNYEPGVISSLVTTDPSREKYRYRLMQAMEPTENMSVFPQTAVAASGSTSDQSANWLTNIKNPSTQTSVYVTPLVDNVIALIVWPKMAVSDDPTGLKLLGTGAPYPYAYDSQANVAPSATAPYKQSLTADQLPPDVQVTMVVLDDASAARMAATMAGSNASQPPTVIENALKGSSGTQFTDASQYSADLAALANALQAQHLNFQFFSTTVVMRESKWTN